MKLNRTGSESAAPPPRGPVQPARYVRISLFCAITGFTERAVRHKIEEGEWRLGEHYVKRGRIVLMDMEGYYRWAEEEKAL